jgi:hypothetical protein
MANDNRVAERRLKPGCPWEHPHIKRRDATQHSLSRAVVAHVGLSNTSDDGLAKYPRGPRWLPCPILGHPD